VYRTDIAGIAETEVYANFFQNFLPSDENAMEPVMDVYYPILNDLSPNAMAGKKYNNGTVASGTTFAANTTREVVGIVVITIYWRNFFRNILPEGANGIIVVVQNPCHNSFTYQINGPHVEYLGVGDSHREIYSDLHQSNNVVDLNAFALRRSVYTGAPIETDFCPYTALIYASNQMKSEYITQHGVVYMVIVLLIFAFTSVVFFSYDWFVERRQMRVMSTALRSTAIVSSLFPSTVRDQLYPAVSDVVSYGNNIGISTFDLNVTSIGIIGSPIAQVYPETTVIFADIVGFTSWSATRAPTEVFHLLETVYAGFDKVAKIHGVYKIETIGDSYVAVVGLPQPRKRHALLMIKFANDIRRRMTELTKELAHTLGPVRKHITPLHFDGLFLICTHIYIYIYILISRHVGDVEFGTSHWIEFGTNHSRCIAW
jgi:Adenylate and Guanylate cyclase catalytic domain